MKALTILLVFLSLSCKSNFQNDMIMHLTNNHEKLWYIDYSNRNPQNDWLTLWYFTKEGDYLTYLYNQKTEQLKLNDSGDNLEENRFEIIAKDSISLNGSKFPIIELSSDEFIIDNIYSYSFFPEDSIRLKNCLNENNPMSENCERILQEIERLNETSGVTH